MTENRLENKRRFLDVDQKATLPFVVEFKDGRRGEAVSPRYLMDLVFHEYFSDIDEIETLYLVPVKILTDLAGTNLAIQGVRAIVYDGLGPVFDNAIIRNEEEVPEATQMEFQNMDNPVLLDGWDPWTAIASMVRVGNLKIYEKYPVWSDKTKKQGCDTCIFKTTNTDSKPYCSVWESEGVFRIWDKACFYVTNGSAYFDYHEVTPEDITKETCKYQWKPFNERIKEHIGLRPENSK